ncbi:hypothetical protein VTN00DRAFT_9817 [Thermoascus crustaceus]|uniref:uncharacterized protein n=1 Tax=Thermoascus crustaceus TaxID=5088 RepID=UPI00374387CF
MRWWSEVKSESLLALAIRTEPLLPAALTGALQPPRRQTALGTHHALLLIFNGQSWVTVAGLAGLRSVAVKRSSAYQGRLAPVRTLYAAVVMDHVLLSLCPVQTMLLFRYSDMVDQGLS